MDRLDYSLPPEESANESSAQHARRIIDEVGFVYYEVSQQHGGTSLEVLRSVESHPRLAKLAKAEKDPSIFRLPGLWQQFMEVIDKTSQTAPVVYFAPRVGYISLPNYIGAMVTLVNATDRPATCHYRFRYEKIQAIDDFNVCPGDTSAEVLASIRPREFRAID